jgi:hypothetical protein
MKTAVIYARYSYDNQTEQSIEGQLRVCHDYAERNGILIVDTYIYRAMTGTNDLRPDFQRMMKDSGKKQWNYVLVYRLDRFSRNKYEATVHKNTLKNNGVKWALAVSGYSFVISFVIPSAVSYGVVPGRHHANVNTASKRAQNIIRFFRLWLFISAPLQGA